MDPLTLLICAAALVPFVGAIGALTSKNRKHRRQELAHALPEFFNKNVTELFDAQEGLRGWRGVQDDLRFKVGFTPHYRQLVFEVQSAPIEGLKRLHVSSPHMKHQAGYANIMQKVVAISTSSRVGRQDSMYTSLSTLLALCLNLDSAKMEKLNIGSLCIRSLDFEYGRIKLEFVMESNNSNAYRDCIHDGIEHARLMMQRILDSNPTGPSILHGLSKTLVPDSPAHHTLLNVMLCTYPDASETISFWHKMLASEQPKSLMFAMGLNPNLFLKTIAPPQLISLSAWARAHDMMPHATLLRALETTFSLEALHHTMLDAEVKVHLVNYLSNKHGAAGVMPALPHLLRTLPSSARRALVQFICAGGESRAMHMALTEHPTRKTLEDTLLEIEALGDYARVHEREEDHDAIEAYILDHLEGFSMHAPKKVRGAFHTLEIVGGAPTARALNRMLEAPTWKAFGRMIKQTLKLVGMRLSKQNQHGHLSLSKQGHIGGLSQTIEAGGVTIEPEQDLES